MGPIGILMLFIRGVLRDRAELAAEILALRHCFKTIETGRAAKVSV